MESPARLLVSIPHSGEWIPPETPWLHSLEPFVALLDVDRFVDRLYAPALQEFSVPHVIARVHRYAVDLNRLPEDIDASTVQGAPLPPGTHPKGFHWAVSTQGHPILTTPMSMDLHQRLVALYHDPFHAELAGRITQLRGTHSQTEIFHLDCHSMPSQGTAAHADAGEARADVVISDFDGKSARPDFMALVVDTFRSAGLKVSVNWPYKGGRITQRYGRPAQGHHTVQIELNRALYMDESTRQTKAHEFSLLQSSLRRVIAAASAFSSGASSAASSARPGT